MKPKVFVGSAGKSIEIVERVVKLLNKTGDLDARPWPTFFKPGTSFVKSLEEAQRCEFGVFVFSRDDAVISKGKRAEAPRDNVVFEAGMLAGVRGFERLFILLEDQAKLLSDLSGFNVLNFRRNRRNPDVLKAELATACSAIHAQIMKEWSGPRIKLPTRKLIAELLESSCRLATLGTKLAVGEIRSFCHLHDGGRHLIPIACFTGNRHDKDEDLPVLCHASEPEAAWFCISQSYLNNTFMVRNVSWTKARRAGNPGAKEVRAELAAVAAHPIVIDGHPCGTLSFDSLRKVEAIGWSDKEEKERLRVILKSVAHIVAELIS
jgi:hypothetical protein